jgi:hypothetical protein
MQGYLNDLTAAGVPGIVSQKQSDTRS